MRKLLLTVVALVTVVGLSSCGLFYDNDSRQGDARMQQIADVVNSQDKAALEALFSNRAVEQATDLDQRLDYFLSFFPNGGLTWEQDPVGSKVIVDASGRKTELLDARYTVSAGGKDYWLVFRDLNEAIDPENVGLYALGVHRGLKTCTLAPHTCSSPGRARFSWTGTARRVTRASMFLSRDWVRRVASLKHRVPDHPTTRSPP